MKHYLKIVSQRQKHAWRKIKSPSSIGFLLPPQKTGGVRETYHNIRNCAFRNLLHMYRKIPAFEVENSSFLVKISKTCHFLAPKKPIHVYTTWKGSMASHAHVLIYRGLLLFAIKIGIGYSHLLSPRLVCWENMLKRYGHVEEVRIHMAGRTVAGPGHTW